MQMSVFVENHSGGDSVVLDVKLTCRIVTRMVHTGVQHTQNYSMGDNNNNSKEGGRGCSLMVEWRQCGKLQIYCFCKGLKAGIFCPANFSLMMRNNKKSHELDKAKSGLWLGWTRTWMHLGRSQWIPSVHLQTVQYETQLDPYTSVKSAWVLMQ